MRNMRQQKGGKRPFPNEAVLAAVSNIDETRSRLNLAGLGLAAPLLSARAGHAAREAARAEADPRASKEERAERAAVKERVTGELALLRKETERTQVTPTEPTDSRHAVLYGRVIEGGKPVARARIVAEAPGARLGHACADKEGRYALQVPGDVAVTYAVARATGPIVHRDKRPTTLIACQRRYREFDLGAGEAPCEPPRDDEPPPKDTTPKDIPPKETPPKETPPKEPPPKESPPKETRPPKETSPPKDTPPRTAWYEPARTVGAATTRAEPAKAAPAPAVTGKPPRSTPAPPAKGKPSSAASGAAAKGKPRKSARSATASPKRSAAPKKKS